MKKIFFLLLILLLSNSALLYAQQTIKLERLSTGDGFSNELILCPFQDSYGLLWAGSGNGLNVYDGYKVTTYKNIPGDSGSIINNTAFCVDEDKSGNIWIGTFGGMSKFIRSENRFINFMTDTVKYKNAPQTRSVAFVFDNENNVWVAELNRQSIKKYDTKTDKWEKITGIYRDSGKIKNELSVWSHAIAKDKTGKIWIGSSRHNGMFGLGYYSGQEKAFVQAEIIPDAATADIGNHGNEFTRLYFDQNNILWFTTRAGVYKYDQKTKKIKVIERYTVNNNQIFSFNNGIFKDVKGNVWVTNNFHGILKFKGVSDTFERIKIEGWTQKESAGSNLIFDGGIKDNSGIIWMGSRSGLFKYNENNTSYDFYNHNEKDVNSLNSKQINCLTASKKYPGKVYIGTENGNLNIFDVAAKKFENIPFNYGEKVKNCAIGSILEDEDGSLWLGTRDNGLLKMNLKHEITEKYVLPEGGVAYSPFATINVLKKDGAGNIWFGSDILRVLDPKTKSIIKISDKNFAVYPTGLMTLISEKIKNKAFISEIKEVGDDKNLTQKFSITQPGAYLIVSAGEKNGKSWLAGLKKMNDYGWIEDENGKTIWTMQDDRNKFYMGGDLAAGMIADIITLKAGKYALRYFSDGGYSYNNWNLPPTYKEFWGIRIFPFRDDREKETVNKAVNEASQPILFKGGAHIHERGTALKAIEFSGNNTVWIGNEWGLNKINVLTNENKNYTHRNGDGTSLGSNEIHDIYEDTSKGILWIATAAGLNQFDPATEKFTIFTERDGLPSDNISGIVPGNKNELLITTSKGISRMTVNEISGKCTFINYGMADGLGGLSFSEKAIIKTADEKYYFGGSHGLNELAALYTNPTPPMMLFTDLKISNVSVLTMGVKSPVKTSLFDVKEITLLNTQNDLLFEFEALHYANPAKNKYAHKLEGYDKDWIYDDNKFAAYPNLNHGNYVFMIKGANCAGVWDETGKSIKIKILPPWWQTWWFRFILLGIFGSTLGLSVKTYTNRKLRQQQHIINSERALTQERNRIAGEMHDEIGAGLSTIRLISNRAKLRIADNTARDQIEKVADNASELVERMSVIIWAMNSNNDNAEGLISFFQRYSTEFLGTHELDFRFDIAPEVYKIERIITGERRRQVFLVFKETLNNIVKHAQATLVNVNFIVQGSNLKITVSDNGKGFDKDRKVVGLGGNGIVNTGERMRLAHGNYEIKSEARKGTIVTLTLELKNGILPNKS